MLSLRFFSLKLFVCLATAATLLSAQAPPQLHAGTTVVVRTADKIDSKSSELGQTFRASLDQPLLDGKRQLAPKGSDATLRLVEQKSAGKVSGNAALTVMLVSVTSGGNTILVESESVTIQGKSKGKGSALRIGGGAALGAAIGAVAGGGRGAAIGAGAGAGAGTVVAMVSGAQVQIPAETILSFQVHK